MLARLAAGKTSQLGFADCTVSFAFPAATVEGYGEGASTLVTKDQFRFLVDEPVKLGGLGKGGRDAVSPGIVIKPSRAAQQRAWRGRWH